MSIYQAAKQHYTSTKKLTADQRPSVRSLVLGYAMGRLLAQGNHRKLHYLCQFATKFGTGLAHYFWAKSLFLQDRQADALKHINLHLQQHPKSADAHYLKAEILVQLGEKEAARALLIEMLSWTSRKKTWQHLANTVTNQAEFEHYVALLRQHFGDLEQLSYDLASHLTHAAYTSANEDFALQLWQKRHAQHRISSTPKTKKIVKFSQQAASQALKDLKIYLDKHDIAFFLISGTLLGCVRDGKLLGHDKDIDIGVYNTVNRQHLESLCRQSGLFYVLPASHSELLVLRHLNGTTIDVFIHDDDTQVCRHYGGKCLWSNHSFALTKHHFLGDDYLIPQDYDRYLTENYGDWRTPKIDFDSALDTPNMHITNHAKMCIYLYKRLLNPDAHLSKNLRKRLNEYLNQLNKSIHEQPT